MVNSPILKKESRSDRMANAKLMREKANFTTIGKSEETSKILAV
ncbi:hypothetical protein [Hydrococcus rivularis]|nr:hypothetical protein [Hydrococcus rivularis]